MPCFCRLRQAGLLAPEAARGRAPSGFPQWSGEAGTGILGTAAGICCAGTIPRRRRISGPAQEVKAVQARSKIRGQGVSHLALASNSLPRFLVSRLPFLLRIQSGRKGGTVIRPLRVVNYRKQTFAAWQGRNIASHRKSLEFRSSDRPGAASALYPEQPSSAVLQPSACRAEDRGATFKSLRAVPHPRGLRNAT